MVDEGDHQLWSMLKQLLPTQKPKKYSNSKIYKYGYLLILYLNHYAVHCKHYIVVPTQVDKNAR